MSRNTLAALGLALVIGATTVYAARVAQPPERPDPPPPPRNDNRDQPAPMRPVEGPMRVMAGSGMQITASGKFVYILRGDEILQFDATSLEFIKKVKVPAPDRPQRAREDDRRPPRNDERLPPPPDRPMEEGRDMSDLFEQG